MTELDEALQLWYNSGATLQGATNGLWPDPAPQADAGGPEFPFITYNIVGDIPRDAIRQYVDDVLVMFYVRSGAVSPKEVTEIYGYLRQRFDRADIPVRGRTTVRFDRVGGAGRARDADGGWLWQTSYRWNIQEGA